MQRREFIKMAAVAPLVGKVGTVGAQGAVTFEEFLRESAVSREVINRFLSGPSWARFDPEVGYVLGNYLPSDGRQRHMFHTRKYRDDMPEATWFRGR